VTDWIQKIKTNENVALKEIYQQYRGDCVHWLKQKFNCSDDDAIEIFQMSVIIMYDNIVSGKLTTLTSSIKTYITAIAQNKAMELIRSRKHLANDINTDSLCITYVYQENEHELESELIQAATRCLDDMGDPCKSLLTHYYYMGRSMDEITAIMNYKNADTTKNQKYKCLKRLQTMYFVHIQKSIRN
jgi:RNA polymerase sigma factor (sigma-70 family)